MQHGTGEVDSGARAFPSVLRSFRGVPRSGLRRDALAGLTVWAVLVPESLAYATIAGVPPVVGLYAAIPALLLYALLGSSRHMVVATMSATAALSASIVAAYAAAGTEEYVALTATLAIVTGVLAILRRTAALRLPRLVHLRAGAQGLHRRSRAHDHRRPAAEAVRRGEDRRQLLPADRRACPRARRHQRRDARRGRWSSLVIVLGLRRWLPVVPGSLVAVLAGIAAVPLFDLVAKGVAIVGPIEAGLPTVGPAPGPRRVRLPRCSSRRRGGRAADRVRRGAGRGQGLRRQGRLRHRPEPGAARASVRPTSDPG